MSDLPIALVTGASGGIGRAIASVLARSGFDLLITGRTEAALDDLARELSAQTGRRVPAHAGDLRTPAFAEDIVRRAQAEFGRLDLLVNSAGSSKRADFLELTEEDWQDGFGSKFFGTVRLCRAAWPMLRASRGHVVNIIGAGGRTPAGEFTIGGSINAGLMNFTKALADLGIRDGVRVNGINPGPIRTGRLDRRIRALAEREGIDTGEAASRMISAQRVMRFGEPEEIAEVVAFLAAGGGTYFHGAILDVDGGATKGM